ncbi:unnamed protein product, partial [Ectocarpus sp. 4 AP-2014]
LITHPCIAPSSSNAAHRGLDRGRGETRNKAKTGQHFSLSVHPNKKTGLRSEEREAVLDPRLCGRRYFHSPKRRRETMEKPPSSSRPAALARGANNDGSSRNNVKGQESSTDDSSSDSGSDRSSSSGGDSSSSSGDSSSSSSGGDSDDSDDSGDCESQTASNNNAAAATNTADSSNSSSGEAASAAAADPAVPDSLQAGDPNGHPLDQGGCFVCKKNDKQDLILLCDGCEGEYHTFCVDPPLRKIPDDEWFCEHCKATGKAGPKESK